MRNKRRCRTRMEKTVIKRGVYWCAIVPSISTLSICFCVITHDTVSHLASIYTHTAYLFNDSSTISVLHLNDASMDAFIPKYMTVTVPSTANGKKKPNLDCDSIKNFTKTTILSNYDNRFSSFLVRSPEILEDIQTLVQLVWFAEQNRIRNKMDNIIFGCLKRLSCSVGQLQNAIAAKFKQGLDSSGSRTPVVKYVSFLFLFLL